MMQYHIGIDMGTSSIKALLLEDAACIRKEVTIEYQVAAPREDWKEIDPEVWYRAAVQAVRELLSGERADRVVGIGVTGQMHTTVFLDAEGRSIRPAILWNDGRTREILPMIHREMEAHPSIRYLQKTVTTGSPAANLYWLREKEPAHFARLRRFLIGPDYLVYRLTGEQGTDYCESSTASLVDLQTGKWSAEMCALVGLSPEQLPLIRGSAETVGTLLPAAAREMGLQSTVRVIAGTGDNPAAAIPTGCLGRGHTVISLGTSGVLMVKKAAPDLQAKGKNVLFSFDGKDIACLCQGVVQATGNSYAWWAREMMRYPDFSMIDEKIAPCMDARKKTLFFPYLTGDKTLYQDADIRGAFLGLSTETTREDMTFAVIEGLCLGFRELRDQMLVPRQEKIKAVGGGARSRVWVQTLADVLDTPIEQQDGETGAAYGAALRAAYADGAILDADHLSDGTKPGKIYMPRPERAAWYDQKFRWFSRIYDAVKTVYRES